MNARQPPVVPAQPDLIIRPSKEKRKEMRRRTRNFRNVMLALVVVQVLRLIVRSRSVIELVVVLSLLVALGVAFRALLVVSIRSQRLFVTGNVFGERRLSGRRRSFPLASVGSVRRVSRQEVFFPPSQHHVVLDRGGHALIDVLALTWADRDLSEFIVRLGCPLEGSFVPAITRREFRRLYSRR